MPDTLPQCPITCPDLLGGGSDLKCILPEGHDGPHTTEGGAQWYRVAPDA